MKIKRSTYIFIIFTFFFILFFSMNKIQKVKGEEILTKNMIFDIIDNVEDVIITCISNDGRKNLDNENKFDSTLLYIIQNRDNGKFNIQKVFSQNFDLNQEKIIIGKITQKDFENELISIFDDFKHNISQYKYFDDGNINLVLEPSDFFIYDSKELIYFRQLDDFYEVVYKYKRILNNVENTINVKYLFTNGLKIKDVIILSSDTR